jgi:ABC-type multidrug transport system permease subunit
MATVAIFITWSVMDLVIHGILLKPTYDATASLWRPMEEMNMPLMYLVILIFTACFVMIYQMIERKSLATGIKYGLLFGIASGVSMGLGSYSYMPIPMSLAWGWLGGTLVELLVAGVIVGLLVKSD